MPRDPFTILGVGHKAPFPFPEKPVPILQVTPVEICGKVSPRGGQRSGVSDDGALPSPSDSCTHRTIRHPRRRSPRSDAPSSPR